MTPQLVEVWARIHALGIWPESTHVDSGQNPRAWILARFQARGFWPRPQQVGESFWGMVSFSHFLDWFGFESRLDFESVWILFGVSFGFCYSPGQNPRAWILAGTITKSKRDSKQNPNGLKIQTRLKSKPIQKMAEGNHSPK